MAKMKLWQKYILGIGTVSALVGGTYGGVYLYSQSDSAEGPSHFSLETLRMRISEIRDISKYEMTFRDPLNTNNVVGKYEYTTSPTDTEVKPGKVNGENANEWVEKYYENNKQSPVMTIVAGGIKFNNFYSEAILPADFVRFVHWFSQNVSWSPGLTSITSYTLKKGVEKDGSTIMLGTYTAVNGESKQIKFMPDSFFGVKSFGTLVTEMASGLTKDQAKEYIENVNITNQAATNILEKRFIYSVEKRKDGTYTIYESETKFEGIKAANKMYSSQKNVSDLDVQTDENGQTVITEGKSMKILHDAEISRLELVRAFAAPSKWRGVGTNFLKYVTTHEYGHMQTLSMSNDASLNPVAISPSGNVSPAVSSLSGTINLDVLNNYLAARLPMLRAVAVSPLLVEKTPGHWGYEKYEDAVNNARTQGKPAPSRHDFSNVAYEYVSSTSPSTFQMLNVDKIFGEGKFSNPMDVNALMYSHSPTDPNFKSYLEEITTQLKTAYGSGSGFKLQFLMRNVTDLDLFAKFLGVPKYALMFINSNDNLIATTTPSIGMDDLSYTAPKYWSKQLDDSNHWVADNMFSIKMPGTTKPYFEVGTPTGTQKSVHSPYTGKFYVFTSEAKDFFLNKVLTDMSITMQDYLNVIVPAADTTKKDEIDMKVELLKGKFINWFISVLLNQDIRSMTGNEVLHPSFLKNKDAIESDPFGIISPTNAGTNNFINDFWAALNDITKTTHETYSQFKIDSNLDGTLDPVSTINTYRTDSLEHLMDDLITHKEENGFSRYLNHIPSEVVTVLDGNRYTGARNIALLQGGTVSSISNFAKTLLDSLMQNSDKNAFSWDFTKQTLFALDPTDTTKPFVLLDAADQPITLTAANPTNTDFRNALNRGVKFKWNSALKFNIRGHVKEFNLAGANFKSMPLSDLPKVMSIDTENMEAQQSITIQGELGMHYASFNDTIADTFFTNPATATPDIKNTMKLYSYYMLQNGFKDRTINTTDLAHLAKELLKLGGTNISTYKGLFQRVFDGVTGDTYSTFDETKAKDFLDKVLASNKSTFATGDSVNTLLAWQQILSGQQGVRSNLNGPTPTVNAIFAFPYIEINPSSPIQQWVSNPSEGYVTALPGVFSNYTNNFAEVLTRDWVQMTFVPNGDHNSYDDSFRYQNEFVNITEKETGFDLYIAPMSVIGKDSIIREFDSITSGPSPKNSEMINGIVNYERNFANKMIEGAKNGRISKELITAEFLRMNRNLGKTIENDPGLAQLIKTGTIQEIADGMQSVTNIMFTPVPGHGYPPQFDGYLNWKLEKLSNISDNGSGKLFSEYFMNNGYYKDRWLRELFVTPSDTQNIGKNGNEDWKLYDDHGSPITDTAIRLKTAQFDAITGKIQENVITDRPNAFWWWLLRTYGVGDRTIAGLWRVPDRDAMSMWGILPSTIANEVKFVKATSENGEVKYIPVRTEDTNNLFYLTKQADANSKHKLIDDGYKTWVMDLQVLGTWKDSSLNSGKWKMEFVDENKQDVKWIDGVHNAFTLGSREILTENNKPESYAPVIMKEEQGSVYMNIQDQFST